MSPALYNMMMVLCFFATCLLIGIILMQQSKSGGGLGFLSGGASESFLGANASTILVKITTILIIVFLSLCLIMATGAGAVAKAYSGSIADDPEQLTPATETMIQEDAKTENSTASETESTGKKTDVLESKQEDPKSAK